jgi:hypothetical protein
MTQRPIVVTQLHIPGEAITALFGFPSMSNIRLDGETTTEVQEHDATPL